MKVFLNANILRCDPASACLDFEYDPKALPIWEIAAEIRAQIQDSQRIKLPTDLAKNFDKYQSKTATEDSE